MFYGKVIGGIIGLLVAGLFGLVLGIFVGHLFDKGLLKTLRYASPANIARIKNSFFETTFLLSGYLAKADGRISQQEVDHTEMVIAQMGLNAEQRQQALVLQQTLRTLEAAVASGQTNVAQLQNRAMQTLSGYDGIRLDYLEFVHPESLQPVSQIDDKRLCAIAAFVGEVRLIDNVLLKPKQ